MGVRRARGCRQGCARRCAVRTRTRGALRVPAAVPRPAFRHVQAAAECDLSGIRSAIMKSNALVLFDIDGTLIRRAGPHHREALVEAVGIGTGLDTTTDHIPVHGMLDPDILTRRMRDAGASDKLIGRGMPAII